MRRRSGCAIPPWPLRTADRGGHGSNGVLNRCVSIHACIVGRVCRHVNACRQGADYIEISKTVCVCRDVDSDDAVVVGIGDVEGISCDAEAAGFKEADLVAGRAASREPASPGCVAGFCPGGAGGGLAGTHPGGDPARFLRSMRRTRWLKVSATKSSLPRRATPRGCWKRAMFRRHPGAEIEEAATAGDGPGASLWIRVNGTDGRDLRIGDIEDAAIGGRGRRAGQRPRSGSGRPWRSSRPVPA